MIKKIKELFIKYKEIILYALFGVLTTVANLAAFLLTTYIFGEELYLFNNAVAWIVGVVVAFVTNKLWVFNSNSWKLKVWGKEFVEFVTARLLSFVFEEAGMLLFVDVLNVGEKAITVFGFSITGQIIVKLLLSVVVVILNYVASKFIIFKNKKSEK